MAKRKVVSLGGKKFFSIVVLSAAALGLMFTTFALQKPTNTESEATGGNYGSLTNCTISNGYAGGVQLYNEINKQGGYRIMCVPLKHQVDNMINYSDKNLGSDSGGGALSNIWNFNNKTASMKLRANSGCNIDARLYNGESITISGYLDHILIKNTSREAQTDWKNLPLNKRDKATSIYFEIDCHSLGPEHLY